MGRCSGISILLIDREPGFRSALASMLREDGHHVIECPDIAELPALHARLADVDVLVCAHDLPVENGLWLVDRMHAAGRLVPAILVAGYCPTSLNDELATRPFVRLVEKPVSYEAMHDLIHACTPDAPGSDGDVTVH